jgi:hypothetical protein
MKIPYPSQVAMDSGTDVETPDGGLGSVSRSATRLWPEAFEWAFRLVARWGGSRLRVSAGFTPASPTSKTNTPTT